MSEENLAWARRSLEHFAETGTPYFNSHGDGLAPPA
jgi:hypothetical protein